MTPPQPIILRKTALAVIKDRKVLMARPHKHEKIFLSLGGKVEANETDIEALEREVLEEAGSRIKKGTLTFLSEFEDWAFGKENTRVNIRLYFGELIDKPKPSSEIAELRYFDSLVNPQHITATGKQILEWLKKENYID
jgi:8-oxo-dGTP pyrophosphatase MutT (NUDIX family)